MGCINSVKKNRDRNDSISSSSSPSRDDLPNDLSRRIFDVEVHNNRDHDVNGAVSSTAAGALTSLRQQGQLEITDDKLIYRTRGRNPTIWPLKFLRKYGKGHGQDKDIFSFECGRHCSTGSGVFIFRCAENDRLFALLLDTINRTSTQQQTLNQSNSQHIQSNTSRSTAPVTTPTSNGHHSQQQSHSTHQQSHLLTSQHSENELLREYVNIPTAAASTQSRNNVPSTSSNMSRPRSSLDQRANFALPAERAPEHEHFDGPSQEQRSSFDSSTLPNRRSSASNRLSQPCAHQQQMPLYVNSKSFDAAECDSSSRKGNSTSFDDVSAYTNVAFFNQQLSKDESMSKSQKCFESSPNYIQLDLAATSQCGIAMNRNSPINGAKSLSNLSRGGSPLRFQAGSNSGSANSLNRSHQSDAINFLNVNGRPSKPKITLDSRVPLPTGLSYATIDFEKTSALSQVNRQQLAVNGNY